MGSRKLNPLNYDLGEKGIGLTTLIKKMVEGKRRIYASRNWTRPVSERKKDHRPEDGGTH